MFENEYNNFDREGDEMMNMADDILSSCDPDEDYDEYYDDDDDDYYDEDEDDGYDWDDISW